MACNENPWCCLKLHIHRKPCFRPPVGKQTLPEAAPLRDLEKTGRDDLIRVDVVAQQNDCARRDVFKFRHGVTSLLASAIRPSTAEAAAVNGEARKVRLPGPCRP